MAAAVSLMGAPLPHWLLAAVGLGSAPPLAGQPPLLVLTQKQSMQLFAGQKDFLLPTPGFSQPLFPHLCVLRRGVQVDLLGAAYTSARLQHCVSNCFGDCAVDLELDAPALSVRGRALTNHPSSLDRLAQHAAARGYSSPFWVSESDLLALHGTSAGFWGRLLDSIRISDRGGATGSSEFVSVLLDDAGPPVEVINVGALQSHSHYAKPQTRANLKQQMTHFRIFEPVNVFTGSRLPQEVADHLRRECGASGRWCSVWGTPEEYAKAGVPLLDGPIGCWVMDPVADREMFLVSAFSAATPVHAFCSAYRKPPDYFTVLRHPQKWC